MPPAKRLTDTETNRKRLFSLRVIHARRCANLTHIEAAARSGLQVQRIKDFEAMQAWPQSEELDALASVYEVADAWLTSLPPYDL